MKKLILTLCLLGFCVSAFGADEITIPDEPLPTINRARMDTIIIRFFTKQAQVIIRKGFMNNGKFVGVGGKDIRVTFQNIKDDPDTPEDETVTDFDDFIKAIKTPGKAALKTLVKSKLP